MTRQGGYTVFVMAHPRNNARLNTSSHGRSDSSETCPQLVPSPLPLTSDDDAAQADNKGGAGDGNNQSQFLSEQTPQRSRLLDLPWRLIRDPASVAGDHEGNTRVVPGPSRWSPNEQDARVCGDIMPESWHRERQKRDEQVGKIVGPQANEAGEEPEATTTAEATEAQKQPLSKHSRAQVHPSENDDGDVFVDSAQRQSSGRQHQEHYHRQRQQEEHQCARSPSSPRSSASFDSQASSSTSSNQRQARPILRACATRSKSQGVLPFVGLGQGRFLKLTQSPAPTSALRPAAPSSSSPPIHVTRSTSKPRASPEVNDNRQDLKEINPPFPHEVATSDDSNDTHSQSTMLGASRWASSSEDTTPKGDKSQKRPLRAPSKWATGNSPKQNAANPPPKGGNAKQHGLQPSKWAAIDTSKQDDARPSGIPSGDRHSPSKDDQSVAETAKPATTRAEKTVSVNSPTTREHSSGRSTKPLLQPSKWATVDVKKEEAHTTLVTSDNGTPPSNRDRTSTTGGTPSPLPSKEPTVEKKEETPVGNQQRSSSTVDRSSEAIVNPHSKWVNRGSSRESNTPASVTAPDSRQRSPLADNRISEGSVKPFIQPSKWASEETTPSKKEKDSPQPVLVSTPITKQSAEVLARLSPTNSRKNRKGRNRRPKSRNSAASDIENSPEEEAHDPAPSAPAPHANEPVSFSDLRAEAGSKDLSDNSPSAPTSDRGFQIRGNAKRTTSHISAAIDASRKQENASEVPTLGKYTVEMPDNRATTHDSSIETPLDAAAALLNQSKADNQHDKGTQSQQSSPEDTKSPRQRRPSATYIPPHLRRRMQEEKARQAAGLSAQPAPSSASGNMTTTDNGIQIRGRGGRQPIALQHHFSDDNQNSHDMLPSHQSHANAVGLSPPGPVPGNLGNHRVSMPPAGSYPGPYNRQPMQSQGGGYHMPISTSRTAFASHSPSQASSLDQRFPQPAHHPQQPYQGQGPRMMPAHPMGQQQQQSFMPASYPPYPRGMMGPQQGQQHQHQQQQQQHPGGRGFTQQSKHATGGPQLSHGSPPSQRHPEGFEQVSQNHLRYNPNYTPTPPPQQQSRAGGAGEDDIAERLGAVRLNDKQERGGPGAGRWRSKTNKDKDIHIPPAKAQEDQRAQDEERERNRLRKLQSAKSRGWDSRKDEHGKIQSRNDQDDPERLALRNGPDRVKEDRERRKMLLSNHHDEEDDDGVVYPEPGRLEPIDFGDEFEKKEDKSKTGTPAGKDQEKGKEDHSHSPKHKIELTPLPDLIEPGTSWADLMDEEEWE